MRPGDRIAELDIQHFILGSLARPPLQQAILGSSEHPVAEKRTQP